MPETTAAAERAYRHTKELILGGDLHGGDLLSEGVLAAELGISRTPVHEAFLRLGAENLLALSSRRGAAVVPMAPDEARDVLEMRESIELSTARRALSAGLRADVLAGLRDNVERQRRLATAGDVDGFVEADNEFHATLVRASGNRIALHFHDLLRDRQHRLRRQILHVGPANIADALADHELMLAAAERGDSDGFCRLISQHVARHRGLL